MGGVRPTETTHLGGVPVYRPEDDKDVDQAVRLAEAAAKKGERIVIVGWSRGAIRGLNMAQRLAAGGIEVEYLGLIDPVDTFMRGYSLRVPASIHRVYHSFKALYVNKDYSQFFENAEIKYETKNGKVDHVTAVSFAGPHIQSDDSKPDSIAGSTHLIRCESL